MGIVMKAFVCLSLLLFCSYIKASARPVFPGRDHNPIFGRSHDGSYQTGSPIGIHPIEKRPCPIYSRCRPPGGVGKQVVDNKLAKKSVIEPQGRSGYNGGLP